VLVVQVAAKSKEFCLLSREQILSLISSSRLLVSSEGAVYKAVVSMYAGCSYIRSHGSKHNVTIPHVIKRPRAIRPKHNTSYLTKPPQFRNIMVLKRPLFCNLDHFEG
jgi:hypothetical protein